MTTEQTRELLRQLPSVEEVLNTPTMQALQPLLPHSIFADCARASIDE